MYKKGQCLKGLIFGFVFWDDENGFNGNVKGGIFFDGEYIENILI